MDSASSGTEYEPHRNNGRRYGMPFSYSSLLSGSMSALLEFSGLMRGRHHYSEVEQQGPSGGLASSEADGNQSGDGRAEVSIRIIGSGENEHLRLSSGGAVSAARGGELSEEEGAGISETPSLTVQRVPAVNGELGPVASMSLHTAANDENGGGGTTQVGTTGNARDNSSQRYDFQQLARWVEQVLPFTMLLLMVFIRQHLQGFIVTFWISAVMVKANDLLRKQTALKGERKPTVLLAIGAVLLGHVTAVYWWYREQKIYRPLFMLPPKEIPKFWQALFVIVVNDTMVRQAAMVVKSGILIRYKNSRGHAYRRQAQLLTLIEYTLLLYRALLPTPVWYRFFLNKEYGNLFSSLTTGLYLTFKLTATLEKVQRFLDAVKAFSRREVQYGTYATIEEVLAAGDLCAICQEKMHAPISLRCNHIFCEDCASEWFERERTCPLCRAVVKSASLRSFGDGSTSLFSQLF